LRITSPQANRSLFRTPQLHLYRVGCCCCYCCYGNRGHLARAACTRMSRHSGP